MRSTISFVATLCLTSMLAVVYAQEPVPQGRGGGAGAGPLVMRVPLESKAVKGAPYSAETVNDSTQTLADGNRIVRHSTGRVYRDGQGRVRREEDRASGNPAVSIVDPGTGVAYALDPQNHIAWKTAGPAGAEIIAKLKLEQAQQAQQTLSGDEGQRRSAEVNRRVAEASQRLDDSGRRDAETQLREDKRKQEAELIAAKVSGGLIEKGVNPLEKVINEQRKDETLEPRAIEGVPATGHRVTTTIPAGAMGNDQPITIVSEEWVSPDLGVLVLTQRSDPRSGESTYRLMNILRSEPDPSLFEVPSDYTVRETGIRRNEPARRQ